MISIVMAVLQAVQGGAPGDVPEPSLPLPQILLAFDPEESQEGPPGRRENDFGLTAALRARWSVPFGAADRDLYFYAGGGGAVVSVDSYVSWADLFDPGWGLEAEIDVMLGWQRGHGERSRYGFYLSAGIDHYEGDTISGAGNAKIRVDDMDMATFIVGGKMVHPLQDNFVAEGRMGIGAVHYHQVDAEYTSLGFNTFRSEFIEDTWTFAFELRGAAGLKLGPLMLSAGLGTRILAPPHEGGFVDLSSGAFWTFDVDIGAALGF